MKPCIYVVANKGLHMSAGKLAAQVGHAVAGLCTQSDAQGGEFYRRTWRGNPQRWLIVLEAQDGEQLYHLGEYLADRKVPHYRVIDEGVNEIPPFSLTAVGVGVLDKDSPEATYLGALKKYDDHHMEIATIAFNNGVESRKWLNRLRAWYNELS